MMVGSAAGSSTFHSSWRLVAPNASPASISCFGTVVMPRWVSRIGAGDGEDHRGDEAGREAEAEQHERRDQIDEGRQRLHQVEHRPQQLEQPFAMRRGDAERHADRHRDGGGADDQRQRLDRLLPQSLVDDVEQSEQHAERDLPWSAAGTRRVRDQTGDDHERRRPAAARRSARRAPGDALRRAHRRTSRNSVVRKSKNCLPHLPDGNLVLGQLVSQSIHGRRLSRSGTCLPSPTAAGEEKHGAMHALVRATLRRRALSSPPPSASPPSKRGDAVEPRRRPHRDGPSATRWPPRWRPCP